MDKKRKICVITGTRAEYGIMSRLMKSLKDDPKVILQVIATNMHLSPEFGMTVSEIENDGFRIDKKIEMLLSSDTHVGTVKSMGLGMIGFADAYDELKPDLIVILGDRYEMLAAASAAQIFGIPVAHLHGGEITEGAYDDSIRHAISKLSYLHFTATNEYRQRVIQMGEEPDRVFNTGALSAENILNEKLLSLEELEESINFVLDKDFLLVTYHPVTREPGQAEKQINDLLQVLEEETGDTKILFTLPNSDTDGRLISQAIKDWCERHPIKATAITSLGRKRYYSALAHCGAVIGNSSSGIGEAPSFKVPTLNIGNRQKGRTQGNTVYNCDSDIESLRQGILRVLSKEVQEYVKKYGYNPFYKQNTLENIKEIIKSTTLPKQAMKKFYDIKI